MKNITLSQTTTDKIEANKFPTRQNILSHINLERITKLNHGNINNLNNLILYLDFPIYCGGTQFFTDSILTFYSHETNFLILRKLSKYFYILTLNDKNKIAELRENEVINFINNNLTKISKIFINHVIKISDKILDFISSLNKEISLITHDHYFLTKTINIIEIKDKKLNPIIPLNKVSNIFTQNIKNLDFFDDLLPNQIKYYVSPLPDLKERDKRIDFINKKIKIGFIGNFNQVKGDEIVNLIFSKFKDEFDFFVFGIIENKNIPQVKFNNIIDFNNLLEREKPNIWLSTSIWMETYSFTTTLKKITDLPVLLYQNNFPSVIANRLNKYHYFDTNNFETLKKLIIENAQNYLYMIKPEIHTTDIWDNYFLRKKPLLFPIYFPQFHETKENNISFYPEYTDIKNLKLLKSQNPATEIPLESYCEIDSYDYLKNGNLLQQQIDLLEKYHLDGFAMYYYWFSTNTISNQRMIFEKVINQFFEDKLNLKNKKIFFIWANEDWTKNPAFGETKERIENNYQVENLEENFSNLINYFKHPNYLKINNKPVFYLHHPWFIKNLMNFRELIEKKCLENNFNGIILRLNDIGGEIPEFKYYSHHPNYKNSNNYTKSQGYLAIDYQKYLNNIKITDKIQTIFFDFDNQARLIKPNKSRLATRCVNNSKENKISMVKKVMESYQNYRQTEDNLILINAFNEWGEKMTLEPSDKLKDENLEIIKNNIF